MNMETWKSHAVSFQICKHHLSATLLHEPTNQAGLEIQSSAFGLQKVGIVDSSSPLLKMVGVASGSFCTLMSRVFSFFSSNMYCQVRFSQPFAIFSLSMWLLFISWFPTCSDLFRFDVLLMLFILLIYFVVFLANFPIVRHCNLIS